MIFFQDYKKCEDWFKRTFRSNHVAAYHDVSVVSVECSKICGLVHEVSQIFVKKINACRAFDELTNPITRRIILLYSSDKFVEL